MKKVLIYWTVLLLIVSGTVNAQVPSVEARLCFGGGNKSIEVTRGAPVVLQYRIVSKLQTTRDDVLATLPDSLHHDPEITHLIDSVFRPLVLAPEGSSWLVGIVIKFETQGSKRFATPVIHPIHPMHEEMSTFSHTDPLFVYFGIDPEATRKMPPGKVTVKIGSVIHSGQDTLWAAPVEIKFSDQRVKSSRDLSEMQQLEAAKYLIRRGRCNEAASLARELFGNDTTSVAKMLVLAEAEECLGNHGYALQLMLNALEIIMQQPRAQANPPDMLMLHIMRLQEKVLKRQ
jgi:hypothetical protein